ncbi:hypothetical protein KSD_04960 [Ktedonobacter sp. SOSP1-85]|nr:MFS transporter [Ktedonobacter sp. SOSP1-85]GHO72725.1 hypothetical protein KSD_04960 [Ktedonobacter sp. SOSP1-85]
MIITLNPQRGIDWRILLLALGMFALGTDAFVVAGVLPVIAGEMHVTEGLAGQLVTVFSLTYGLGAPVLAAVTSRWSRNRMLLLSLGAFCLANIGSALAPTFSLLLLTRFLAGCCAATFAPLAYTTGTSLAPAEKRGQALALVVLGLTVATVFGSPLGTWVGEHFGWRLSFGLVAALAGIAFLALLIRDLPKTASTPALSLKARLAPIAEPQLLLALAPHYSGISASTRSTPISRLCSIIVLRSQTSAACYSSLVWVLSSVTGLAALLLIALEPNCRSM